jgi:hypothetical protein
MVSTSVLSSLPTKPMPDLLDLVDFKWLMAAEGHRINLTRLQADTNYAEACFVSALYSECEALRYCARRLHESLALVEESSEAS